MKKLELGKLDIVWGILIAMYTIGGLIYIEFIDNTSFIMQATPKWFYYGQFIVFNFILFVLVEILMLAYRRIVLR